MNDRRLRYAGHYLLLALITFVALILRLYKLGEWSFWGDEIITVVRAQEVLGRSIIDRPLSLVLTQAALVTLGTSEWSARLVPALIGAVTIPVLYFPVRKLFDSKVALVSGMLLAVSPWHLYWSQNARFYTSLLLFYTLALLAFHFGLEEDRPGYLLVSVLLLALASVERLIALFLAPVVLCYLLLLQVLPFEKPPGLRPRNLGLLFLPGLILVPFFVSPYVQHPSEWLATFGRVNNNPFWILSGVVYYMRIPTISMGGVAMLYLLNRRHRTGLLLSTAAMLPLISIMVISPFHYTANRYIFVSLTSWVILASFAAVELFSYAQNNARLLVLGAMIVLLLDPLGEDVLYFKYQNGNRDDWKAAFEVIQQNKTAGDLVVSANPRLGNYYLRENTVPMEGLALSRIITNGNRVWFVEDMNVKELYPELHGWLAGNAQLVANLDVHVHARNFKMRIFLYDPADARNNAVLKASD